MTAVAEAPTLDEPAFSAADYTVPVPQADGRKATRLDIRFSGSGELDRTSIDDLVLLEAMRLGEPVRLIVVGTISDKGFRLGSGDDPDLAYSCTVRVESVEAGEIA